MKRLFAFSLTVVMLLFMAACTGKVPVTEPSQAQTQPSLPSASEAVPQSTAAEPAATTTASTEAPTEAPTEPTEPVPETVTVYLLEKTVLYDSGTEQYLYDENYNITSRKVFTIENALMSESFFEDRDANGMPCSLKVIWPDGSAGDSRVLTYYADGKLKEEMVVDSNFSGVQYAYDQAGNRTQKRTYYEGILETAVNYEYSENGLCAAYSEDKDGNRVDEYRIEDGRIVEKIHNENGQVSYSYLYKYDAHGNLTETSMVIDGETLPVEIFQYKAVEVDAGRAQYLTEQQKYLLDENY